MKQKIRNVTKIEKLDLEKKVKNLPAITSNKKESLKTIFEVIKMERKK